MAARIDKGRVQLLTRTGLDWTAKYPNAAAALANLNVKTAYLDGELCGVDEAGLPSFSGNSRTAMPPANGTLSTPGLSSMRPLSPRAMITAFAMTRMTLRSLIASCA